MPVNKILPFVKQEATIASGKLHGGKEVHCWSSDGTQQHNLVANQEHSTLKGALFRALWFTGLSLAPFSASQVICSCCCSWVPFASNTTHLTGRKTMVFFWVSVPEWGSRACKSKTGG